MVSISVILLIIIFLQAKFITGILDTVNHNADVMNDNFKELYNAVFEDVEIVDENNKNEE
jgi:archaellum component FlaG (FlaF/FlaG flagellin family)